MPTTLHDTDGSTFEHGYEVLYTPRDAAAILGVSPRTLNNWAREGKIRNVRTKGGHHRYPADVVRAAYEGRWADAKRQPDESEMHPSDVQIVVVED